MRTPVVPARLPMVVQLVRDLGQVRRKGRDRWKSRLREERQLGDMELWMIGGVRKLSLSLVGHSDVDVD